MYSEALEQHIEADYSPTPPKPIPIQLPGETLKFCPEYRVERYRTYFDQGPFSEAECAGYEKRPYTSVRSQLLRFIQNLCPKWFKPDPREPSWFKIKVTVFNPVTKKVMVVRFAKPYSRIKELAFNIKRSRWFRPALKRFRRLHCRWYKWKLYARSRSVFAIISEMVHHSIPDSGRFMP